MYQQNNNLLKKYKIKLFMSPFQMSFGTAWETDAPRVALWISFRYVYRLLASDHEDVFV
jgi:hypothetical protein